MDNQTAVLNLDDFENTQQTLGSGTYGTVYLVKEKKTNIHYAAKVSKLPLSQIQKTFSRELSVLVHLDFPSIMKLKGYNETDFNGSDNPTLITEYCKKGSLQKVIISQRKNSLQKDGYENWNNTKKMINLIGIALGMNYIHDHNFIHRDLKADNVLLDENLYPKICDFGQSKLFEEGADQTMHVGSPYYMAPEATGLLDEDDDEETYSFPVDVYSFGILAYEIYSGEPPIIPGKKTFQVLRNIVKGSRPDIEKVPEHLREFIVNLWNQEAIQRPIFSEVIDKLLHDKERTWLDDVDTDEVEEYLHQFGLSLNPQNSSSDIGIIQSITEQEYPNNANRPKSSVQQLYDSDKIPDNMKDYIRSAESELNSKDYDFDLLYYIGWHFYMGNKSYVKTFPQDFYYALRYFLPAASNSNKDAVYAIALIYSMDSDDKQKEFSVKVANVAADLGSVEALYLLGISYRMGLGCSQNVVMAAVNFKIAADKSNVDCMFLYGQILLEIGQDSIDKNKLKNYINEAEQIIHSMTGKRNYFYVEASYTLETVKNEDAAYFVGTRYIEKAANKGNKEAAKIYEQIKANQKVENHSADYYQDLYKTLTQTVLNS